MGFRYQTPIDLFPLLEPTKLRKFATLAALFPIWSLTDGSRLTATRRTAQTLAASQTFQTAKSSSSPIARPPSSPWPRPLTPPSRGHSPPEKLENRLQNQTDPYPTCQTTECRFRRPPTFIQSTSCRRPTIACLATSMHKIWSVIWPNPISRPSFGWTGTISTRFRIGSVATSNDDICSFEIILQLAKDALKTSRNHYNLKIYFTKNWRAFVKWAVRFPINCLKVEKTITNYTWNFC